MFWLCWRLVVLISQRILSSCCPLKAPTVRVSVASVPCATIWGQRGTAALISTADWALGGCDSSKSAVLTSFTSLRQNKKPTSAVAKYTRTWKCPHLEQQQAQFKDKGIEKIAAMLVLHGTTVLKLIHQIPLSMPFYGSIQEWCDKWNGLLLVWDLARFCSFSVAAFLID